MRKVCLTIAFAAAMAACSAGGAKPQDTGAAAPAAPRTADSFCADSAYAYVAAQVAMGPRTPGSEAGAQCADWIAGRLQAFGADSVGIHRAEARRFDGAAMPLRSVYARFGAPEGKRILLLAHYDTRPWADRESDPQLRMQPIPGANDGASGVGVLLEIARALGRKAPKATVEMLFVDGEDSGYSDEVAPAGVREQPDTWCLGTQAWLASNPWGNGPRPAYAILLDMVGGAGATFPREQFSDAQAARIVDRIRAEAASLGYGETFPDRTGGAIVDDHLYIARAGIPAVDIIESMHPATMSFPPYWHTHADNMDNIDPTTLERVGRTVLSLIYKEK